MRTDHHSQREATRKCQTYLAGGVQLVISKRRVGRQVCSDWRQALPIAEWQLGVSPAAPDKTRKYPPTQNAEKFSVITVDQMDILKVLSSPSGYDFTSPSPSSQVSTRRSILVPFCVTESVKIGFGHGPAHA